MTAGIENIGKYIKEIAGSEGKSHSILAYVTKVNEKKMVCEVESSDNSTTYYNVRLKEVTKKEEIENGFWLIPEIGSKVIIDCIAPSEAYVSMVSEVKKVHYRVKKMRVGLSEKGFSLDEEGGNDFKTLLDELFDFLSNKYMVQTAWGPSGTAMPNVGTELNDLKGKFAKILTKGDENAAA